MSKAEQEQEQQEQQEKTQQQQPPAKEETEDKEPESKPKEASSSSKESALKEEVAALKELYHLNSEKMEKIYQAAKAGKEDMQAAAEEARETTKLAQALIGEMDEKLQALENATLALLHIHKMIEEQQDKK
jgi:hypothetical protein